MDLKTLTQTLRAIRDKKEWLSGCELLQKTDLSSYYGDDLRDVLDEFYMCLYYAKQYEQALDLLCMFEHTYVDDHNISNTDYLLSALREGKKVVATFDIERIPEDDEIVICYGDFPLGWKNLVCCNPIQRHVKYFERIKHDVVEYDAGWNPIDAIYIINLDDRADRYIETLRELVKVNAPLHKVKRFPAVREKSTSDPRINAMIGCSRSHLKVIEECINKKYSTVLILEDDFCFSDTARMDQFDKFFTNKYEYDICLLAASKQGKVVPLDNLLCVSSQERTTCAGYLVSSAGMSRLKDIWTKSTEELTRTREERYSCDSAWTILQKNNRFLVFREKMGFQRPTYDYTTRKTVFHLD